MNEWLKWLKWYCLVALAPDPRLEELFDPPMISHTWKRNTKDQNSSFLWRCWDLGDGWTLGTVPPSLSHGRKGESGERFSDSCGDSGLSNPIA